MCVETPPSKTVFQIPKPINKNLCYEVKWEFNYIFFFYSFKVTSYSFKLI